MKILVTVNLPEEELEAEFDGTPDSVFKQVMTDHPDATSVVLVIVTNEPSMTPGG